MYWLYWRRTCDRRWHMDGPVSDDPFAYGNVDGWYQSNIHRWPNVETVVRSLWYPQLNRYTKHRLVAQRPCIPLPPMPREQPGGGGAPGYGLARVDANGCECTGWKIGAAAAAAIAIWAAIKGGWMRDV